MFRTLLMTASALIAMPLAAKPVAPTIEQMAAFPAMSNFSLSPDGKYMVGVEARGEERVILVWDISDLTRPPKVIGSKQMKIQRVDFLKDNVLGVTLWQPFEFRGEGVTKTFISKYFLTDIDGKNWREPLPLPRATTTAETEAQARTSPTLLNTLVNDPDHILVVNNVGDSSGDVYKVNVRTNRAERVQRSEEGVADYATDLEGNLRARIKTGIDGEGAYTSAQFRDQKGGPWEEHFRGHVKTRDATAIVGFTQDANVALILTNVGRDKAVIQEYDVAKRKLGEVLFQHRYFEASNVIFFPFKNATGGTFGEITGLEYDGPNRNDVQWVSPQFVAVDNAIRKALNITPQPITFLDTATGQSSASKYDMTRSYSILDYSADLKTVLVLVGGSNTPPSTYLLKDGALTLISKPYADIDPTAFGTTSLVYYKARDGLDIPAFLTKPNVELCGAGPWPSVVHPHGGPWSRDDSAFDRSMWLPLMSSRCMAVLQPQFRGSAGWGRKLWMAGDAEWGQKMQDDKDDGAKWLMEQKVAIPGRIAMFGFSYGGYAAFAAAVRPNGLYKCSIAGAGVSDIKKIWKDFYSNRFFRDAQGPTVNGLNPVDFADKIQIPIMVYHGDRDRTVPIEQSEWFVSRAKKAGKDVTYFRIADYTHGSAWTREIFGAQLHHIETYLTKGCGGSGL